jgi:peptidoglycan/xylan/chitin deacetylase (PgdA/CDA1 family)/glycosyltransferase involved in cell wall biosynthesis
MYIMISIVIPALNEEKYLPDCLKSLRDQDYTGTYEIVLCDNGSTDGTVNVARQFNARIIPCPEKKSVFYARQVGADAAQGDIIAQADADTIYPRNWLSRIADRFEKHPEVVALTGRYVYTKSPWWAPVEYVIRSGVNFIFVPLTGRPPVVSGATFAFRRKTFVELGGYHDIVYAPDQWGIASRLRQGGKVAFDQNLRVITSPRSVNKPMLRIFKEGLINWGRWIRFLSKQPRLDFGQFMHRVFHKNRMAEVVILIIMALVMFVVAGGYFLPSAPFFGKVYASAKSTDKTIALTFDDGPNEPYTSEILGILKSHHINATFFVIGENAQLYPDVVNEIISDGNVIGNHSYSHTANHALTSFGVKDMDKAEDILYDITGVKPHMYRPPNGKKSPWEIDGVKDEGLIEVTWDVSANDQHRVAYFGKPIAESYTGAIVKAAKSGAIIQLHDGYGLLHDSAKSDESLTVQALPLIIEQLQAEGYQFVTVPELLNVPAYNP